MISNIPSTHVNAGDGVWNRKALVHGRGMRDSVADVQHNARRSPRGIQAQRGLRREEQSWAMEGFKEYLGGLLTVGTGVQSRLS